MISSKTVENNLRLIIFTDYSRITALITNALNLELPAAQYGMRARD